MWTLFIFILVGCFIGGAIHGARTDPRRFERSPDDNGDNDVGGPDRRDS